MTHAREHITQIGIWLDVVQLRCLDQRTDDGLPGATTIAAGEQLIFVPEGHSTNRGFDEICVELDAAVVQKAGQANRRASNG